MNPLNHVAIIMDGNGRWGLKYRNSRNAGHKEGLKTVETIIKSTIKNRIKFLTPVRLALTRADPTGAISCESRTPQSMTAGRVSPVGATEDGLRPEGRVRKGFAARGEW